RAPSVMPPNTPYTPYTPYSALLSRRAGRQEMNITPPAGVAEPAVVSPVAARLRAVAGSPLTGAGPGLALYAAWIFAWLATGGHNISDFIYIGDQLLTQSHASDVIRPYPGYHYVHGIGYDGQLYYYLALDPANARFYLDTGFTPPDYRYTRIVYPM